MRRIVFILSLIVLCTSLQAQKYLRYTMKDRSFNGFYTEYIDSIVHNIENGFYKSHVYVNGALYTLQADSILDIKMENAVPSLDNFGDYRLYEFDFDTLAIKKVYVDNRASLCASYNGDFGSNDTIVFISGYNGIAWQFITDEEGRIRQFFDGNNLFFVDYEMDSGLNYIEFTNDGYVEHYVEDNSYSRLYSKSYRNAAWSLRIAEFFSKNEKFINGLSKLSKDRKKDIGLSIGASVITEFLKNIGELDKNPELRNQCLLVDVASLGLDAWGVWSSLCAAAGMTVAAYAIPELLLVPAFDAALLTSYAAFGVSLTSLGMSMSSLYKDLFPSKKQMEVYRDYYKKKYGINIEPLPATEITCISAVLNGSITSLKGLRGNLYFSVEPISKTLIANSNVVSEGLWKLESNISDLEPGNAYSYIPNYRIVIDGLELIYSGGSQSFTTLTPKAITGTTSNESMNSATISCSYENVPEDGICGVEYTWNDGSVSKRIGRVNGTQAINLTGLKPGTTYTYCAFVEAFGKTYYGKFMNFSTSNVSCSVTLSDFKVTKSRYKEDGFENDGVKYDYRFDASITATLNVEDISYIREWGYVYEDPNGKKAEIPLSEFGTNYTDSRYAYFRNSAHSTARLYGYAYIVGSDSPIYGEVHDYPLDHNKAVATTGDCSNVTTNSATVTCSFENVPEGGVCGVEYTWSNGSKKQVISNADGPQTITLSGLESGTAYSYCAYVEAYGQTYYGEEKSFNTKNEIPDITGVWNCKEFQNGTQTGEATFELKADGAASSTTISGSGGYSRNSTGHWSINDEGHVTIQFSWQGFSGGGWKSYGGTINSFVNPTQIEGTANDTYVGNMGGGGQQFYQFVMTR